MKLIKKLELFQNKPPVDSPKWTRETWTTCALSRKNNEEYVIVWSVLYSEINRIHKPREGKDS